MLPPSQRLLSGRQRNPRPADDPGRPAGTAAGDANGGGADVSCGRRRDGASWLAWMSIRSGRYVPSSENPPGQPVALECPERPGRDVGPAAEFVRQFCFRRQPGPRRVFAVPDPPREHGVNVRVGLRVPPRIIQTSHTGSVTAQPRRTPCASSGTPARGHTSGMVYARVTTSPGRRHESAPGQGQKSAFGRDTAKALSAKLGGRADSARKCLLACRRPGAAEYPPRRLREMTWAAT
jgi:hypothetical protein